MGSESVRPGAEIVDQWAVLSGILSGFAFGLFGGLLSVNDQRLIARLAVSLVMVGAMLLLTATVIASFARIAIARLGSRSVPAEMAEALSGPNRVATGAIAAGLLAFLSGGAMAGWMHSATVGAVATGAAVVCGLLILGSLLGLVRAGAKSRGSASPSPNEPD